MKFRNIQNADICIADSMGFDYTPYNTARLSTGHDDVLQQPEETIRKFMKMLLENGHLVPFEHIVMTFKMTLPIFVFRHLFRYRTASISELSMRYTQLDENACFYMPTCCNGDNMTVYKNSVKKAVHSYIHMIRNGVSKEMARIVLPVSMFSTAYFTINMRNFLHLLDQRVSVNAQNETAFAATRMMECAFSEYPIIMGIYTELKQRNKE